MTIVKNAIFVLSTMGKAKYQNERICFSRGNLSERDEQRNKPADRPNIQSIPCFHPNLVCALRRFLFSFSLPRKFVCCVDFSKMMLVETRKELKDSDRYLKKISFSPHGRFNPPPSCSYGQSFEDILMFLVIIGNIYI